MKNDELEKALEETWKNKEKFYENTKDLSIIEIIKMVEKKYETRGNAQNRIVIAPGLKSKKQSLNIKVDTE